MVVPVVVWLKNLKHATRIPHRDGWDIALAGSVVAYELFSWVRMSWFISAWAAVLRERVTRRTRDRWALQYEAEAPKGT